MDTIICIWLSLIGAVFGSFLGCMGYRIPNKIKTTYPSSFCSNCKKPLKWYMNIPIISYIFLGGKCAYCKTKIGIIYFICELICFILFPVSYLLFKFDINFFISICLTCMLTVTIVSDFKFFYISDRVLVISAIFLLGIEYYFLGSTEMLYNLAAGVVLFLIMFGIKILGNSMFGRESLGDGDIKLMGVVGIALGIFNSFVALFFSAITALIFSLITLKKNKEGIIPYGPFIIIGALIVVLFGDIINPYLTDLFSL